MDDRVGGVTSRTFILNVSRQVSDGASGPGSLTTLFALNNGGPGNTFDLEPFVPLQITGFDVSFFNGNCGPTNVTVYWKNGSSVGSENTAGAWTSLGTVTGVTSGAVINVPVRIPVGGLTLVPGGLYGIYVHSSSCDLGYTNGATTFQNTDLKFSSNSGQGSPAFSVSRFPRTWNGTVHYVK
jgi:hypothetical protein